MKIAILTELALIKNILFANDDCGTCQLKSPFHSVEDCRNF